MGEPNPQTPPPDVPRHQIDRALLFASAYFACAEIGTLLSLGPRLISTVWPPSGLYLAVLLCSERRRWPTYVLAALIGGLGSDLLHGRELKLAFGFWLANTFDAVAGGLILPLLLGKPFRLSRPQDILALAPSAMLSSALGAPMGAYISSMAGEDFAFAWRTWWVGYVVGIVLITPAVCHAINARSLPPIHRKSVIEFVAMITTVFLLTHLCFGIHRSIPMSFLIVSLMLWPGLRFCLEGVAVAALTVALIVVHHTNAGWGSFSTAILSGSEQVLVVQMYFLVVSLAGLVLATVVLDRERFARALLDANTELEARVKERTGELLRANAVLRESEERYRVLTETLPHMVWTMKPNLSLEFVNRSWTEFTGLSLDLISARDWLRFVHPEDQPVLQPWLEGSMTASKPCEAEFRLLHRSGEFRWVFARAVPREQPQGVSGWLGAAIDIHARKLAEAQVREDESRFRAIAAAVPGFLFTTGPDGLTDYRSRQFYDYTNLPDGSGLGLKWIESVHPDERTVAVETFLEQIQAGKTFEVHTRFRRADGVYRWFLTRAVPSRDETGRNLGSCGICIDVDDQKRAEEQLRELNTTLEHRVEERTAELREREERFRVAFDDAPIGVGLIATDGRWLRVNRALCELFGRSEEELLGSTFQALTHPEDLETNLRLIRELLDGVRRTFQYEKRYIHRSGRIIPAQVSVALVRDDSGAPLYFIAQVNDITERRRAEEMSRSSLREKEILLKEIHHRVKNNLQIVSTLLDLQSGHTSDLQALTMFRESRDRVRSMALIHDRLYRSADLGKVGFAEYARRLADELFRAYRFSGDIQLSVEAEGILLSIDVAIPCGLILNELISNCLKHAFPDGSGGQISVNLQRDTRRVVLSVADNGIGMPPEMDVIDSRTFGLQLVTTLVEQLRGRLEVRTGTGTEFLISFPESDSAPNEVNP